MSDAAMLPAPDDGRARRDAAMRLLQVRRAAFVRRCARTALTIALKDRRVTADAVRDAVPIPPGINPKAVGAAFALLADAGILARIGYRPATRPVAHCRIISIWHLADDAAARDWLASHPELPEPAE